MLDLENWRWKAVSKLIILDANVIIVAHRLGFWKKLVSHYKIHIPSTIIRESKYFEDTYGQRISINLSAEIESKSIIEIEANISDMHSLYKNFKSNFIESIDDGEKEALAILYSNHDTEFLFCTGDMRAICALAIMDLSGKGISLEKVLIQAGINKEIGKHFSDSTFKWHLNKGFQEKDLHKKK
jgi:hypothetical protein